MKKDVEHYIIYKHKRAIVRKLSRKLQNESWEEKYVTGAKRYGFKVLKKFKEDCSDRLNINGITTENWQKHLSKLLHFQEDTNTTTSISEEYNAISMEEDISKLKI